MFEPRDADRAIAAAVAGPLEAIEAGWDTAVGRVLARDVATDLDQPPFDRVAMDGIAIRHDDWQAGMRSFRVLGTQGAGAPPLPLSGSGTCVEIMTGAMLPDGADTVIPVERLTLADGMAVVGDTAEPTPGANVHRRASDRSAGATVLHAGTRLRGPEIAVLASVGATRVPIVRMPRIAIISTGDELVDPGATPKPWQVRRSNAYGIAACLAAHGCPALENLHIPDDLALLTQRLHALVAAYDVLVLSGGVSAGRYDYVPAALAAAGVERRFHHIAQRPGRPMWFGRHPRGTLVFGLPGNPVSTLVCLVRYVLPALARLEGATPPAAPLLPLAAPVSPPNGLTLFLPVALEATPGGMQACPRPTRGSGDFTSLAGTDGFVEVGTGQGAAQQAPVAFYHW